MIGKISRETIEWYLTRGKRLCLLDSSLELDKIDKRLRGKKPLRNDWTKKDESAAAIIDHAQKGGNLGFVIDASTLVIDVDPRNGGTESLRLIEQDLGNIDLREIYPVVETGSGGIHIYCSKSPAEQTRKKSHRYPGIDFLSIGAHVVIPGSYHFLSKKYYEFDDLSAWTEKKFPPIPENLLKHIRQVKDANQPLHRSCHSPELSNDELALLLQDIDPTAYRGQHDDWLSLMFACHHATSGDGRRAFVDWCIRDKKYAKDEGLILHRWDSVLDDEENLVTYRTLMKAVRDAGGEVPDDIDRKCKIAEFDAEEFTALTEFDDVVKAIDDDFDDLGPADDEERAELFAKQDEIREETGRTKYEALTTTVSGLTNETVSSSKIEKIAKLCIGFDDIEVGKIQTAICKYAKISMSNVKRAFSQTWRESAKREAFDNVPKDILGPLEAFTGDMVPVAVAMILKQKYRHGHTICKGQDGAVYTYDGKKWVPLDMGEVDGVMREALALADPQCGDVAKHMPKCKTIMMSVLRTVDFTSVIDDNFDIFNFQNCEIWVESRTGKRTKKSHSFQSFQTAILPYEFDAAAKCPSFSKALPEILSCYGNSAGEVERHLWELFGYTLTRQKNIAAFVSLTGPGGNGKSRILDALTGVLGGEKSPYALYGSLSDFGSGKSAHAFSQLVGKVAFIEDDAEYGKKLPNEVLKKVSENKALTANPKYKQAFTFENRAICWLAGNSWPYTGDTSNGIRRRAHIFNLTRNFKEEGIEDNGLADRIKAEAPGIFNVMIQGLIRLRKRGQFLMPVALQKTAVRWEQHTNPVVAFIIEGGYESNEIYELYDAYKEFCFTQGRGDRVSIPRLKEMLESLGCRICSEIVTFPARLLEARDEFQEMCLQKKLGELS